VRNQYKLLAEKYIQIKEWVNKEDEYLANIDFDKSPESIQNKIIDLVIEPETIESFKVEDYWVDDHLLCYGVIINDLKLSFWWQDDPEDTDEADDQPPKNSMYVVLDKMCNNGNLQLKDHPKLQKEVANLLKVHFIRDDSLIKSRFEKKKIDPIYKKGSEEAGIEIDIEEAYQQVISEERNPDDPPALVNFYNGELVELLGKILGIKDAREVNNIIKFLEEVVGPSLGYQDYAGAAMQRYVNEYIDKNLNGKDFLDPRIYDYININYNWSSKPPKIKKAIADSFKQMYKEYTVWKKTQEVLKKGSEEAGIEIDIEEGVEEDYKKFDIEIPRVGDIAQVNPEEWDKIYKNTFKNKTHYTKFGTLVVTDIDVKNEMLYVVLGKYKKQESTLNFLKDEQITYDHKPKINTIFYSRFYKVPILVNSYYSVTQLDGGEAIEYWLLCPDKSQPHLPLATTVPFSVGVDNWSKYKNWLKTQKILKKGSEEAGIEIDI